MNKISTPCLTCNVKACLLINSLDKSLLPIVNQYKTQFQFKKGEIIFNQGDPVSGVYFIQSGVIKQEITGIKGKPLILRLCGQGKMMGHRSISSKAKHPYTATAVEDCRICFMDLEFFKSLLRKSEQLQKEISSVYLNEIRQNEERLLQIAHLNVKEKVAEILVHLAEAYNYREGGPAIRVHVNRQDMANFAGTTKEQVSKIIAQFSQEQLVRCRAKQFQFFNIEGLKKIAAA
ncbi:Crp/Fnr family transcriptional regulator [Pollutibacter soli]|uniref:Crp/Fnr family transcriptional regulator n=1 Tax=Pollutibacter soli TaxID=3034157 RepID=UPI0030138DD1